MSNLLHDLIKESKLGFADAMGEFAEHHENVAKCHKAMGESHTEMAKAHRTLSAHYMEKAAKADTSLKLIKTQIADIKPSISKAEGKADGKADGKAEGKGKVSKAEGEKEAPEIQALREKLEAEQASKEAEGETYKAHGAYHKAAEDHHSAMAAQHGELAKSNAGTGEYCGKAMEDWDLEDEPDEEEADASEEQQAASEETTPEDKEKKEEALEEEAADKKAASSPKLGDVLKAIQSLTEAVGVIKTTQDTTAAQLEALNKSNKADLIAPGTKINPEAAKVAGLSLVVRTEGGRANGVSAMTDDTGL